MSLLATITSEADVAEETDTLGQSKFGVVETGIYPLAILAAYLTKSKGGAVALNLDLAVAAEGVAPDARHQLRQQLWVQSGTAKGGKTYYERDGKKHSLPGYLLADALCMLTLDKTIGAMETSLKAIKLWSAEAQAEVITEVEMIDDLIGQHIYGAIEKQLQDKSQLNEATNVYEPTGESREVNELQKFFRAADKMTIAEIKGQGEAAGFYHQWDDANSGKPARDRTTKDAAKKGARPTPNLPGAKAPAAGGAPAAAGTASMFSAG